ncbi:MAG TPA: hypothetical protein VNY05_20645 [Candidatus Acidoferrales bacterium]|jgi:hypothetical protein|nr:hypothetical protein [Candidatus Acidoferrales bacterium]
MTKQFKAISGIAAPNVGNGFQVVELVGAILTLLYGFRLTYPTPDSASLLAVDAHIASFLAIGFGQLMGMAQRSYGLRRLTSFLALLMWAFTSFYSFEPAQLVFAAIAAWGFLRIGRSGERSRKIPNDAKESIGEETDKGLCSA